jgi:hypothetical protein
MKKQCNLILEGLHKNRINESEEDKSKEKETETQDECDTSKDNDNKDNPIDEDKWITIHGAHVLVSDKGEIKNKNLRKKIETSDKKS